MGSKGVTAVTMGPRNSKFGMVLFITRSSTGATPGMAVKFGLAKGHCTRGGGTKLSFALITLFVEAAAGFVVGLLVAFSLLDAVTMVGAVLTAVILDAAVLDTVVLDAAGFDTVGLASDVVTFEQSGKWEDDRK
eukprot:jgi/Chrzof1/195/Cz01g06190.t1